MISTLSRSALATTVLLLAGCAATATSELDHSALESLAPVGANTRLTIAECNAAGGANVCTAGSRLDKDRACTCIARDALRADRDLMSLIRGY